MNTWLKVIDKLLAKRLRKHLEGKGILSDEQAGFRKGRGCQEQILSMELIAQIQQQQGKDLHICLIDIAKAFDSVSRPNIFNLLEVAEYDQHEAGLLKAIYKTETSSLIINGRITQPFRIH